MHFHRPPRNLYLTLTLTALALLTSACGDSPVAQVPHESEAIEIIDLLKEQGFDVSKEEVAEGSARRWSVQVYESPFGDEASRAMQVLRDYGLPRPQDKGLEGAYEEQGMFPSESAQQAQRLKEMKTEIERQLRILPGVTRVSVNLVPPEDRTLNLDPAPATASVVILHKDVKPSFSAEQIQRLVAGGVKGLKPENVSVTMTQQAPRPAPRQDGSARLMQTLLAVVAALLFVAAAVFGWMWWRQHSSNKRAESAPKDGAAPGPQDDAILEGGRATEELPAADTAARRLPDPGETGGQRRRAT